MSKDEEWAATPETSPEPHEEEAIQEESAEEAQPTQPKIDLNRAKENELRKLPGIGKAIAAHIIRHRAEFGPFREPAEITGVRGISQAMYERIADRLTVGPDEPESWPEGASTSAEIEAEAPETAEAVEERLEAKAPEMAETPEIEQTPETAPEEEPEKPHVRETPPRGPEPPLVEVQTIQKAGWGRLLLVGILCALLGAALALTALFFTNGTLDFQASANRALRTESFRLQEQVDVLDGQLAALEARLQAFQDLTPVVEKARADIQSLEQGLASSQARIDAAAEELAAVQASLAGLESRTGGVEEQVSELQARASALQEQIGALTTDVEKLQAAAGRFDAFLSGLRELLSAEEETPEPQLTPMPATPVPETPEAEGSPTAEPRITVIPLATPTPTPSP